MCDFVPCDRILRRAYLCVLAVGLALHHPLRYTVLTSPTKGETAVHCCDPALSDLVMLVSRNVFYVVSALQSIVFSRLMQLHRYIYLISRFKKYATVQLMSTIQGQHELPMRQQHN